jgi:plasmid stabilization system protein ParE
VSEARWTPEAATNLDEIVDYIDRSGRPTVAERLAREIVDLCDRYARMPRAGPRHPELPDSFRVFAHKRWLVVYEPLDDDEGIVVHRVVDGTRDVGRLLGDL